MERPNIEPLRLLFLTSNPPGTRPLGLDQEYYAVRSAYEHLKENGVAPEVDIRRGDAVRARQVVRLIEGFMPHILHFAGHGELSPADVDESGGRVRGLYVVQDEENPPEDRPVRLRPSSIVVAADDDRPRLLPDHVLVALFLTPEVNEHIRLVLLNACWAAGQARMLVNEALVPFAIGMTRPITDPAAICFAEGFYQCLFDPRYSLQSAFESAITHTTATLGRGNEDIPYLEPRRNLVRSTYHIFDHVAQIPRGVSGPSLRFDRLPTAAGEAIPEPAPLPIPYHMPFRRDPAFVPRDRELRDIAVAIKRGAAPVVLCGIGGVGKTLLAVEWTHRYGQFFGGGVFWLDCTDPASVPLLIATAGAAYRFPGYEELALEDKIARVREAWKSALPTLLVLDNCETPELLAEYTPASGGARLLVTSHNLSWSETLHRVYPVPVDPLPRVDSVTLLRNFRPDLDAAVAGEIAAEMGDLPLQLNNAGTYLYQYRGASYGDPSAYLESLRQPDLIEQLTRQAERIWQTLPTFRDRRVARTYLLSIDRLKIDPRPAAHLAQTLLISLAHFAPGSSVPVDWLAMALPEDTDERDAVDAAACLAELGFARLPFDGFWRLHRIIADVVVAAADPAQRLQAAARSEEILLAVAPEGGQAGFVTSMSHWLPHARHVAARALPRRDEAASILANVLGQRLNSLALYDEAATWFAADLSISRQIHGVRHLNTAISYYDLADVLTALGRTAEALPLYMRALAVRCKILGPRDALTARTIDGLARVYYFKEEYQRALPLFKEALDIRRALIPRDDPDLAASLNDLAAVYQRLEKYDDAYPLFRDALDIYRATPRHATTATALNNLASLYRANEELGDPVPLYNEAIDISLEANGERHPNTAAYKLNLGEYYVDHGRPDLALPLFEEAFSIFNERLGANHHNTTTAARDLAACRAALPPANPSAAEPA